MARHVGSSGRISRGKNPLDYPHAFREFRDGLPTGGRRKVQCVASHLVLLCLVRSHEGTKGLSIFHFDLGLRSDFWRSPASTFHRLLNCFGFAHDGLQGNCPTAVDELLGHLPELLGKMSHML